jgi:hypothetical protein
MELKTNKQTGNKDRKKENKLELRERHLEAGICTQDNFLFTSVCKRGNKSHEKESAVNKTLQSAPQDEPPLLNAQSVP